MMSLHDVFYLARRIIHNHTQYYVFMQLMYWLRRLQQIEPMEYRQRLQVQWRVNTIMFLVQYDFPSDAIDFIMERISKLI